MKINSDKEYKKVLKQLEELMMNAVDSTEDTASNREMINLADAIEIYEYQKGWKMEEPTVMDYVRYKMHEKGFNNKYLAELIGISQNRMGEFLSGKKKLTIQIAKGLHQHLGMSYDNIMTLSE